MKLKITPIKLLYYYVYKCELESKEAYWVGEGHSPWEAVQEYLHIVRLKDKPGDFDYDWCKSKGLIQ